MRSVWSVLISLLVLPGTPAGLRAQAVVFNELMSDNIATITDEDGAYPDWVELYNPGPDTADLRACGLSDDPENLLRWQFPPVRIDPQGFQLIFLSGKDRDSWIKHWETVIIPGDTWAYHTGQTAPGGGWQTLAFNDQNWPRGEGGIGYGDGDDATVIEPVNALYMRRTFSLHDTGTVTALLLHMDYDDAFVAYLNGIEIARANIGTAGIEPAHTQSADTYREAEIFRGGKPEKYDLAPYIPLLMDGENILAVQVHNFGSGSSDLSAIPYLSLGLAVTPLDPRGMPAILEEGLPELHTGFKISSAGEPLYLTDRSGSVLDSISATGLLPDRSYGRQPDGGPNWVYFDRATPDGPNNSPGYDGISQTPAPDRPAGFYPGAIMVRIPAPPEEMKLYYTTDGSVPDALDRLYTTDLLISQTTVLRCRAFEPGKLPGQVVTATYFIGETQHLPVLSISTGPDYLWSPDSGIYVMGPGAEPEFPYFGANFWQDWEIPVHLELYEPGGIIGFSEAAGMKITGAWNRGFPQKSLAVFFRGEYGKTALAYPLFPDQDIGIYDEFVLRNSGNDWGDTFMRDGLMTTLGRRIGLDAQAYRPVAVYLNGEYWGIHNMREKVNEDFLAAHHPVDPDQIDLLEDNITVLEGDDEHYRDLMDMVVNRDIASPEIYRQIGGSMDTDNFIDYQICEIYIGNTDWPGNNIKYWRPRKADGRWRWILFDTDFGFGLFPDSPVSHNTIALATDPAGPDWPNPPWSTLLLRRLLMNAQFRLAFINRFADLLNTSFHPTAVSLLIAELRSELIPEIERHHRRWELDPAGWHEKVEKLDTYAFQRLGYMRMHLSQYFGLEGMVQVRLENPDPRAGTIRVNSIPVDQPSWQGAYFQNIPIRVAAAANTGWRFDRWSGGIETHENPVYFTPDAAITIRANFVRDSLVVINEINYNSSPLFEVGDWVEFLNTGKAAVDVGGWAFRDEDDLHVFEFPVQTMIAPDSFLVICNDSVAFTSGFPEVDNLAGVFDFGLSGSGELIRLYDDQGVLIDSLTYDDAAPWPAEADGQGATLALRDPGADNSRPDNWFAAAPYGTPGRENIPLSDVRIGQGAGLPGEYSVGPVYPNPFNPSAWIPFELPEAGHIRISIYDIHGRMVTRLLDDFQTAGKHKISWQPAAANASGIYFFLINAGAGWKAAGKMILLR